MNLHVNGDIPFGNEKNLLSIMLAQLTSLQNRIDNLTSNIYPVGSIYMIINSTNPGTFLGVSSSGLGSHRYVNSYGSAYGGQIIQSIGGSGAHNNMPSYLTVYCWKRTRHKNFTNF